MKLAETTEASSKILEQVPIAVIGYGAQGRAQAQCFKDSGLDVTVGVRPDGASWQLAQEVGMKVASIAEASKKAQLIHILIPDEVQRTVYQKEIARHVTSGKTVSFSHGFNILYGYVAPPDDVDCILVAPKAPGTEERKAYLEGSGVPGLIAIQNDASGDARNKALALADALGCTRAGVLECSFEDETFEDLFGEQTVLCGGVAELIKAGFETLVDAGYPPEMAYFECLHELKLIVDLIYEGGLERMWDVVSNTAEYGGRMVGPKIITPATRDAMKTALGRVQSGEFAKEWMQEYESGMKNLDKLRAEERQHPIEVVGRKVRSLFKRVEANH
ncbi:MAG: ketol-acid reductoisomerase [Myxococcota bacterium]|nr:ketol-acid reductoisomerase [Myxococcota bacterium]